MKVEFKWLPHGVGLPLPSYETPGSAGCDLRAAVHGDLVVAPGERVVVPLGFALAIPQGWEAQIRPRSGLAVRHGITVLNAPGTIDSDYRGELMVPLVNLGREPFPIRRGDRIAQLVLAPVTQAAWREVESLDATVRGDGGFGSTGRH